MAHHAGIGGVGLLWENQFGGYWIVTLDSKGDSSCGDKGMYFRGKMGKVGNGLLGSEEQDISGNTFRVLGCIIG